MVNCNQCKSGVMQYMFVNGECKVYYCHCCRTSIGLDGNPYSSRGAYCVHKPAPQIIEDKYDINWLAVILIGGYILLMLWVFL